MKPARWSLASEPQSKHRHAQGHRRDRQAGQRLEAAEHRCFYDAFAHLPLYGLEDLGFCKPGEAAAFVNGQKIWTSGGAKTRSPN
jgi:acetyl-CoA acetyltransferase